MIRVYIVRSFSGDILNISMTEDIQKVVSDFDHSQKCTIEVLSEFSNKKDAITYIDKWTQLLLADKGFKQKRPPQRANHNRNKKRVVDYVEIKGKRYETVTIAAKELEVDADMLRARCTSETNSFSDYKIIYAK